MPRRRNDDDEYEYDAPPLPPRSPIGAGIGIGALAGLVSGEAVLVFAGMDFMKNAMGPAAAFLAIGLCFLIIMFAPFFVLVGICGGIATAKLRSTLLGILIGVVSAFAVVFILWGCGAIKIEVNNKPVPFTLNMALWSSGILSVSGVFGALFTGLIALGKSQPQREPPRRRRRVEEDEDREDERARRRRRDEDEYQRRKRPRDDKDEEDERPKRRRPADD
jgi:hypothetical protein